MLCVLLYNLLVGGMNELTARTAKVLEKGICDTDQCTNVSTSFYSFRGYSIVSILTRLIELITQEESLF